MKINVSTISSFNKKFIKDKKRTNKLMEILNYNREDIEKIIPQLKNSKQSFKKEVERFNTQPSFKIIDYIEGCLVKFSANIPFDNEELEISVPIQEKDKREPLAKIVFEVENKNQKIIKYKKLKAMMKSNGVKLEEDADIKEDKIIYTLTSIYPWYNINMWSTIRAYNNFVIREGR